MSRTQISATLALIVLSACARAAEPAARPTQPTTGYQIEIEQITPAIGSTVTADSELELRVRWDLPEDADPEQHMATVLFQTTDGGLRGPRTMERPMLTAREGIREIRVPLAELLADTSVQRPLTGMVMLQQLIDNESVKLPAEAQQRIEQEQRTRAAEGQLVRAQVRTLRTIAQSERFYFNGDAPAPISERAPVTAEAAALEQHMQRRINKALAVIHGANGAWAYGYSSGFATADSAVARALSECQENAARRKITGNCALRAVNGVVIPR